MCHEICYSMFGCTNKISAKKRSSENNVTLLYSSYKMWLLYVCVCVCDFCVWKLLTQLVCGVHVSTPAYAFALFRLIVRMMPMQNFHIFTVIITGSVLVYVCHFQSIIIVTKHHFNQIQTISWHLGGINMS